MSNKRIRLIILISLIVAATVFTTKVYESVVIAETTFPDIYSGFKVFKNSPKVSFLIPFDWQFVPKMNVGGSVNGIFNGKNGEKAELEIPYIANGVRIAYPLEKQIMISSDVFTGGKFSYMQIVSSTSFSTNDNSTKLNVKILQYCPKKECDKSSFENFVLLSWVKGSEEPNLLSIKANPDSGLLLADLGKNDINAAKVSVIFDSLKFKNSDQEIKSWKAYRDYDLNFTVDYPDDMDLYGVVSSTPYFLNGIIFKYPDLFKKGTNLIDAEIIAGEVSPKYVDEQCLPFDKSAVSDSESIDVNGNTFQKAAMKDAGAGNVFEETTYAAVHDSKCFNIMLRTRAGSLLNYDPKNRPVKYDQDKVLQRFNEILSTLRLTD